MNIEPPVPGLLMARCVHGGDYTLAIVRTVQRNEGTAILERAGDAGGVDMVEFGEWRLEHSDEGPAALSVDLNDCGEICEFERVLDALMAELVRVGGAWGIEGFVAKDGSN